MMEFRKRSIEEPVIENKKPRYSWYFKLESESSCTSQEDTESVYSVQNRETDVARDTSDTDTKSLCSEDSDLQVEVEYEVASNSDSDNPLNVSASSSGTDDALAAVGAITAVICDSSYEAWATDEEDSDSSSLEDSSFHRGDFWICAQCKSQNNNPRFQFCDRCFQVRKSFFPPRPRKHKKSKAKQENPVKLESLQSCLNGLSQDSGLGSSQEFPSLQLDKIVMPPHVISSIKASDSESTSRKRQHSESSLSEYEECKRPKLDKKVNTNIKLRSSSSDLTTVATSAAAAANANTVPEDQQQQLDTNKSDCLVVENTQKRTSDSEETRQDFSENIAKPVISIPENRELCIMCNTNPKNSIFLHGNIAHMCSCYKCAMRTWGTNKRCPVCNCKVRNVVKVFTI